MFIVLFNTEATFVNPIYFPINGQLLNHDLKKEFNSFMTKVTTI